MAADAVAAAAPLPARVGEAFADVLRAARPELNARFAVARRRLPELDGDAFGAFLRRTADAWVAATAAVRPERVPAVGRAAFEVGLELVGHHLAGPAARWPEVEASLFRLLVAAPRPLADDPWRGAAALANAAHQLATTRGARLAEWTAAMERLGPRAASLDELLRLGLVAAWRAGLAHYRAGALRVADTLPPPLALEVVAGAPWELGGAGGPAAGAAWAATRERLARDPWHVPGQAAPVAPRVVHAAGAFRGFGGDFATPPQVRLADGQLLVRSGEEAWLLAADAFGATFHRMAAAPAAGPEPVVALPQPFLAADGQLLWPGGVLPLPVAGAATSAAPLPGGVALTFELSHAVVIVALAEPS